MRVFLAVPPNAETSMARRVIHHLGVTPYEMHDFAPHDLSTRTFGVLPRFWDQVDAVVAVPSLPGGGRSEAVLVQVGIAIGRSLPVIVLTEEDDLTSMLSAQSIETARASLSSFDALQFHLGLFVASVNKPPSSLSAPVPRTPKRFEIGSAREALDQLQSLKGYELNDALERWVSSILQEGDIKVVSPKNKNDRGFDFVFSLAESTSSGTVFVEVKGKRTFRELERDAHRLQSLVLSERAGFGLLLYDDSRGRAIEQKPLTPRVVVMGMYEMLSALAVEESLERVFTKARNEAVHNL